VVLELLEHVSTAPFRIGNQPGDDLLSPSFKGVFVSTPPASATPFIARGVGKQEQPIIRNEKEEEERE
jgi:hypothetical protein